MGLNKAQPNPYAQLSPFFLSLINRDWGVSIADVRTVWWGYLQVHPDCVINDLYQDEVIINGKAR